MAELLSGKVIGIRFQSEDLRCTIGTLEAEQNGDRVAFKLFGAVMHGDSVILSGDWINDPKWGEQFIAKSFSYPPLPTDPDGLIRYLVECKDFKGIGLHKAALLLAHLGAETFDSKVRELSPAEIAAAGRLPLDVAADFKKAWCKRSAINGLSTILAAFELTHHQITTVIDALGDEALPILKANPYKLTEVEGFGFKTVDKIALRIGVEKTDPRRLGAGLSAALGEAMSQGHTWSPRGILYGDASALLALDGTPEECAEVINSAINKAILRGDLVEDPEGRAGLSWVKRAEDSIAEVMGYIGALGGRIKDPAPVLTALSADPLWLSANDAQRMAVSLALTVQAMVLTGVAGTGKTTAVKLILRGLALGGITGVELCAPTGKASRRLEQVTGRPCMTVHRLLGMGPRGFEVTEVDAQAVIVDEASMMDSLLLSALLKRLRMGTLLVLVGDVNQLPPVGPGNPLRDIINRQLCPVVALTEVVRQAGALQRNALGILKGEVAETHRPDPTDAGSPEGSDAKAWFLVKVKTKNKGDNSDPRGDTEIARDALLNLFAAGPIDRLGYDPLYEVQVVTAQAPGALGTEALNIGLQRLLQLRRGVEVAPLGEKDRPTFYAGDKVIFTKNNSDLGLLNGDMGIVREVDFDPKGRLKAVAVSWDAAGEGDNHRVIIVPKGSLGDLSLGYALTTHKAQGSEYPCTIVVAHRAHAHLHRSSGRNWLYTAVTRARRTCVLFGDSWGLRNAAAHLSEDKRRTWLALPSTVAPDGDSIPE